MREIAKRLYALSEATGEVCSPERADIYIQALSDLEADKVLLVLEKMLNTARFFPKIPDIREAVLGAPGSPANLQWETISKHLDGWRSALETERDAFAAGFSCGAATFSLNGLDEPSKLTLRRLGGPRAVASANPAHLPLLKKQFIEEYTAVVREHPHLLGADTVKIPILSDGSKFPLKQIGG